MSTVSRVRNAIGRCTSEKHPQYHRYGGRGIRVQEPWLKNWREFAKYLQTLPGWNVPGLVMDRINNDGHYEPGNLRFVTYAESATNKSQRGPNTAIQQRKQAKQLAKAIANAEECAIRLTAQQQHKELRTRRLACRTTGKEVAETANIDYKFLCNFELRGGTGGLSLAALERLLHAYDSLKRRTLPMEIVDIGKAIIARRNAAPPITLDELVERGIRRKRLLDKAACDWPMYKTMRKAICQQCELATLLDVAPTQISAFENGKFNRIPKAALDVLLETYARIKELDDYGADNDSVPAGDGKVRNEVRAQDVA